MKWSTSAARCNVTGCRLPLLDRRRNDQREAHRRQNRPAYSAEVVHVLDASRSVGVVEKLLNPEARPQLDAENRTLQKQLVASYEKRQDVKLVPTKRRSPGDSKPIGRRSTSRSPLPCGLGSSTTTPSTRYEPHRLVAVLPDLGAQRQVPAIFDDPNYGEAARKLFDDAQRAARSHHQRKLLTARGVYGFWPAASEGDDIIVYRDDTRREERRRFHALRQQWERKGQKAFYSLADFVAPVESGRRDYIGAFAVTTGIGADELAAQFDRDHDDYNSIMAKALADRLAEAFAERLHAQVRHDWGYGQSEKLSSDDLIAEKYRGIRPAPGYPAQPDHTEKRTLFQLLDAERTTGIRLTESFAMHPAASVSGLYFAHPTGAVLRRRPHHPRPSRRLRPPQGNACSRGRTLAQPESGLRALLTLQSLEAVS